MRRIFDKLKNDDGEIVVEASLSLVFFVFAMLILFSMYHVTLAQARLSSALNETAKEISQYTYIYSLTGLNDKQAGLTKAGADADKVLDTITEYDYSYWQSLDSGKLFSKETLNQTKTLYEKVKDVFGTIQSSNDFVGSMLNKAGTETVDAGKGLVLGQAALPLLNKHLGSNPEHFLKKQGVGSLSALNFAKSRFMSGGTDNKIYLNLSYQVTVLKLMNFDMKLDFELCAKTCAWTGVN